MTADSTAWATQVRLLAAQLVRRLNAELGDGTVQRVKVRGPASAQARRPARASGGSAAARGPATPTAEPPAAEATCLASVQIGNVPHGQTVLAGQKARSERATSSAR